MSLGDDLMNLSISGRGKKSDPVSDATKKGKVPTLGEVKRSLKVRNSSQQLVHIYTEVHEDVNQKLDTSNNSDGCLTKYVYY